MNNAQKNAIYSLFLVILMVGVYFYRNQGQAQTEEKEDNLVNLQGVTMGVVEYNIKYLDTEKRGFQAAIDTLLADFNQSLSTYIPDSEISTFNKGSAIEFDLPFFYPVLARSKAIYEATEGAFDPTVGPLVQAWGFGNNKIEKIPSDEAVDSLKKLVGFDKLAFDEKSVNKSDNRVMLNFSAIAKGYAVDVVAELLEEKGIENYLVEIGREVRCKGKNPKGEAWSIAIVNPKYKESDQPQATGFVRLENKAIATSGNYEQFYIKDGKKYAHTIDPKSGYPVVHSLLSASIFADDCMTADAFATAFMVLGLEKGKEILEKEDNIEGFLIYQDAEGALQTYTSEGIAPYMFEPSQP